MLSNAFPVVATGQSHRLHGFNSVAQEDGRLLHWTADQSPPPKLETPDGQAVFPESGSDIRPSAPRRPRCGLA